MVSSYFLLWLMSQAEGGAKKTLLIWFVGINLSVLGFFKYSSLVLPLGISFYVFNQIAYAVSFYRKESEKISLLEYLVSVSFFPYITAGPLVSLGDIAAQLRRPVAKRWRVDLSVGGSLFVIGLFKKAVLGDSVAVYADSVFAASSAAASIDFVHAWLGAISYTFQIYFDFSGYTDMAIGLARMFGVVLPPNFNSPYKSVNIADFWRRWHISLSKFFRDHLYIPLGGNRRGLWRQNINLLVTMILCGVWHGSGWNFVVWGGLHGLYLCGHRLLARSGCFQAEMWRPVKILVTFVLVVAGWVVFRADSLGAAGKILEGMSGASGWLCADGIVKFSSCLPWLVAASIICFWMPNSQQIFSDYQPCQVFKGFNDTLRPCRVLFWRPGMVSSLLFFCLWIVALYHLDRGGAFIYAQF